MSENSFSNAFKLKLLEALSFSMKLFDQNSIQYFACAGTALGAVRHKGFIPWDDDIDLYVPRKDYDFLIKNRDRLFNDSNYELVEWGDDGYYLPFAKIVDKRTTIVEYKSLPIILGAYVDIFPLDYFDCDESEVVSIQHSFLEYVKQFRFSISYTSMPELLNLLFNFHLRTFRDRLNESLVSKQKGLWGFEKSCKILNSIKNNNHGDLCICLALWEGKVYRSEWFNSYIEQPFENLIIRLPIGYKDYLSLIYGDYMKLPPENQRIAKHPHYYINLKERLSFDEVVERVKGGETRVY